MRQECRYQNNRTVMRSLRPVSDARRDWQSLGLSGNFPDEDSDQLSWHRCWWHVH